LWKDLSISKLEYLELSTIIVLSLIALQTSISENFPRDLDWGTFLLYTAGLIFLQSLVRDILILLKKKQSVNMKTRESKLCLCAESTLGLTVLILGILFSKIGSSQPVFIDSTRLCSWTTFWMLFSYSIKDFVIHTSPLRIEKDSEHINILMRWKA